MASVATSIGNVLNEVQSTVANHGKNAVALWKVHERAIQAGRHEEKEFINAFLALLTRVMTIKKGTVPAERLVKFVGTYAASLESKQSGRFLPRLLLWICTGFDCRDKIVRFRAVQIASECVAHLGELDEDIFETLHESLVARLSDKEPTVRVPAAVALARLLGEDENDELLSTLLNRLDRDPAPEVRRAILLNLPLFSRVIPHVLQRTRDVDPLTRKLVYTSVLAKLEHPRRLTLAQRELTVRTGLGDREPGVRVAAARLVTRWFDLVQTEVMEQLSDVQLDDGNIMRAFLAFLALFDVVGPGDSSEDAVDTRAVATDAALAVFVTRPSLTDGFIFSPDYWKDLTPERAVLARVFMEDCLAGDDGSKKRGLNGLERLDAAQMPVVSAFALLLQDRYNLLLSALTALEEFLERNRGVSNPDATSASVARVIGQSKSDDDSSSNAENTAEDLEDALAQAETILSELLRMSMRLDYADESGRRRVFAVVKDMLTHARLLPGLIGPCLDVMLRIMDSERDLIRIIVEVIVDLRDEDTGVDVDLPGSTATLSKASEGSARSGRSASVQSRSGSRERSRSMRRPKTREDMSPAERARADATDMRCLALCIGMLERVHGTFEDNSTLEGVLADLIVPAVKRKESVMREKGLIALGLCCLIARKMAISSFQLFLSQVQAAPPNLKLKVLQIVLDLLIMYDTEFLGSDEDVASNIITFLLQTLQNDDTAPIQAVICVGLAKLLLAGIITDRRVIISLLIAYVSPATSDNLELRQCLSYFFPVYYGASSENQRRVQSVFIKALDLVIRAHEELASDPDIDMVEQHMVSPLQFATMLIEWTDPQQRVEVQQPRTDKDREAIESDVNVHGDLAIDIFVALYDEERTVEDQKILCQLLGLLKIQSGGISLKTALLIRILMDNLPMQCPLEDATSERHFERFRIRFSKAFPQVLSDKEMCAKPDLWMLFHDAEVAQAYELVGAEMTVLDEFPEFEKNVPTPKPDDDDDGDDEDGHQHHSNDDNEVQAVAQQTQPKEEEHDEDGESLIRSDVDAEEGTTRHRTRHRTSDLSAVEEPARRESTRIGRKEAVTQQTRPKEEERDEDGESLIRGDVNAGEEPATVVDSSHSDVGDAIESQKQIGCVLAEAAVDEAPSSTLTLGRNTRGTRRLTQIMSTSSGEANSAARSTRSTRSSRNTEVPIVGPIKSTRSRQSSVKSAANGKTKPDRRRKTSSEDVESELILQENDDDQVEVSKVGARKSLKRSRTPAINGRARKRTRSSNEVDGAS